MSTITTVAVLGAGQMGAGIAQAVALGGYSVRLYDVAAAQLPLAQGRIAASLARGVGRGATTQGQADEALARVTTVDTIAEAVTGADLVIEAAVEDEAVKKAVYAEVVPNLAPHALLATNTSSISITRLASSTDRPDRFIGLHFMKPAPVMKLVEIIRGIATSAETHSAAVAFAESLGKTTTDAEDFPAFIVNRILVPMMNEAIYTLYEGVGNVASIDQALRLGANHPMGPLELADFMGLDVVLAIMNVLYDGLADSKYRPCPLLVKYVEAGWLGRKSGRGFYDYSGETPVPTR
ncbi:MAG: 3-hydroxybutyryl-CoA dehydrogenase [Brevundimonas sp.]|uniref:3-hydroxybutyryl-CoA dehydrogenase n=1 Tax=Brevundimonas albigilva TaxID=1312364 RepID=A0ABY4SP01_9CAUL|nr:MULTISPECIES: 3-hydroxybutyryl-CoA dehydrogenase [Brevundimonas]PZU60773.1 MAG: 3-hydroxybutyryl-CoA dehydrogenase [Brevundimonas sp.]UQV19513.1 3-hydroxybutyryl-CoA dehydrogenase [Brevundimonas albigilva]URI15576.1 3-hydroxybutyryl-CoA dehydrogenase [Brevundimonas albigilva]